MVFFEVLLKLKKYKKPVYIAENGIADRADQLRRKFIHQHIAQVHRAIQAGVDVRGYLHWSLLDNFEWSDGYSGCFGLVEIDRKNGLQRKIRPSALGYAEICKNNYLEVEDKEGAVK
jgi:beta-glucosidase/6-phospho-beta-glucosidase/beta-galactosidase